MSELYNSDSYNLMEATEGYETDLRFLRDPLLHICNSFMKQNDAKMDVSDMK
jgi:hypothetical protein